MVLGLRENSRARVADHARACRRRSASPGRPLRGPCAASARPLLELAASEYVRTRDRGEESCLVCSSIRKRAVSMRRLRGNTSCDGDQTRSLARAPPRPLCGAWRLREPRSRVGDALRGVDGQSTSPRPRRTVPRKRPAPLRSSLRTRCPRGEPPRANASSSNPSRTAPVARAHVRRAPRRCRRPRLPRRRGETPRRRPSRPRSATLLPRALGRRRKRTVLARCSKRHRRDRRDRPRSPLAARRPGTQGRGVTDAASMAAALRPARPYDGRRRRSRRRKSNAGDDDEQTPPQAHGRALPSRASPTIPP